MSITNPRILVLEALMENRNPQTIDELQKKLKDKVAKSTLYRVLGDLKRINILNEFTSPDNTTVVELLLEDHVHHHHLFCSDCGEIIDVNLSNEFVVSSFGYEKYLTLAGSKDILGFTLKYREDPILLDPRNRYLGARLIINLEKLYLSLKKLDLKNDKIENYYNHSHKLGIVPKNSNKLKNKLFGIECNFEELNGIDFKKGCYVGQENTARIKLKNKLLKRLLPIEIINGKLSEDETIYYNDVDIGKVLINEDYPFALIKYLNKNFKKDSIFKSKNATFKIFILSGILCRSP